MAELHKGFGGIVNFGDDTSTASQLANIGEWEFEIENEVIEAELVDGDGFVAKDYGLGSATGSMTIFFDGKDAQHKLVIDKTIQKQKAYVELVNSDGSSWSGTAVISTLTSPVESNEFVQLEVEFELDGAPVFNDGTTTTS